jgi:hypothetical protein
MNDKVINYSSATPIKDKQATTIANCFAMNDKVINYSSATPIKDKQATIAKATNFLLDFNCLLRITLIIRPGTQQGPLLPDN